MGGGGGANGGCLCGEKGLRAVCFGNGEAGRGGGAEAAAAGEGALRN